MKWLALKKRWQLLPDPTHTKSLWGMCFVSFLWTTSSMMVFSILAPFLCHEFHFSYQDIGIVEGLANAGAFFAKFLAGVWTDYSHSRIGMLTLGSTLTVTCKLLFALASTAGMITIARILDRLSKGIRAAPADAILADLSPQKNRGLAYGLRQTFMTSGAVFGIILAIVIMHMTDSNYRAVMYLASFPALLALIIQISFVRQPLLTPNTALYKNKSHFHFQKILQLPQIFWLYLLMVNILMFARFSENFLVLRAMELHWPHKYLPIVLGAMNLIHAFFAYPMGQLSDQKGYISIMSRGLWCLIFANILIISAKNYYWLFPALVLVGIELSMTQGILKAIFSRIIPTELRGTGFSLMAVTTGVSLYYSNSFAGRFAHFYKTPRASFIMGLLGAIVTLVMLRLIQEQLSKYLVPIKKVANPLPSHIRAPRIRTEGKRTIKHET